MGSYTELGDLTKFAQKVEKLFVNEFGLKQRPGIVIAFTLPPNWETAHWVSTLKRQDGIKLLQETATKMISQTN